MPEPKTKGMVALIPTVADAERLAVEGGLPVDEIHLTLMFLGDAADWADDARIALTDSMRTFTGSGPVEGDGFSLAAFNPDSAERDTCIVLGVGGQAIDDIHTGVVEAAPDDVPEQHAPWVAHVSLIYTDDLTVLAELTDRTGPITFDRLRVAFAGTVTDIPLAGPAGLEAQAVKPQTARPLARTGEPRRDWYRINNLAGTGAAEVFIYDEIGWFGVSAQEFTKELRDINADRIDVHLNTPGGDAFDGLAIYQALRNHPAHITTYVDSLAASAGSFIAMAGDERVIAPHATMMIHDAFGMCIGNAAEMAKMQDELARLSDNLASIYANRAGGESATWREAMRAETWYSAEEAVAAGLAHRVQEDAKAAKEPALKNSWDLSVFNFAGRDKAPAPLNVVIEQPTTPVEPAPPEPSEPDEATPEPPAAEPEPITTEPKGEDPVSTLSTDVRSRLGLDENADDAAVLAALDALNTPAAVVPDLELVAASAKTAEENTELRKEVRVLASRMEQVTAELAQTKADKAASVKASVFNAAVKDGKISPADRVQWESDYDEAPAAVTRILASIARGTAVPVATAGYTGDAESAVDLDAEFERELARLDGPTAVKGGN